MAYLETVSGADAFLDEDDPSTWNITMRLERHQKYYPDLCEVNPLQLDIWNAKAGALQLGNALDQDPSEQFLTIVRRSDAWTANQLRSKTDALKSFPLRLLTPDGVALPTQDEPDGRPSYICLSYVRESKWLDLSSVRSLSPALQADTCHENLATLENRLPLSDCMWNALLVERQVNDGIWVDKLCIKQDDEVELQSAASSLGLLYGKARKVVAIIEDVLLGSDEARALLKHAQQINSIPTEDRKQWTHWTLSANPLTVGASACALFKIEGSVYFRNIWNNYALHTGREFVFMIPVMESKLPEEGVDSMSVLKMDAKALATILEASRHLMVYPDEFQSFLYQGWLDNMQEDLHVRDEPHVFYGFNAATNFSKEVATPERTLLYKAKGWPSRARSAMSLLTEAGKFTNAEPSDILALILGILYPTVERAGSQTPTMPETVWLINVTALATCDVSVLLHCCQPDSWVDRTIADLPPRKYSWAAWLGEHNITSRHEFAQYVSVKHEIHDEGLKIVVAVAGSSDAITQMQDHQSQIEQTPIYRTAIGALLFDRLVKLRGTKLDDGITKGEAVQEEPQIRPVYAQHFAQAFITLISLDPEAQLEVLKETMSSNFVTVKEPFDFIASVQAMAGFPENAAMMASSNLEHYSELREKFLLVQPLVQLVEAIVKILIGHEYQFNDATFKPDVYISAMHAGNEDGMWTILAGLPSKTEHGFYWLVQPDALVEASIDFRFGGTWAVQVEDKDADDAGSMGTWNQTGLQEEANPQKDLEDDALQVKLISRNIRLISAERTARPLYTKTVIMHA